MATDTYINSVAGPDNVEAPAGFGPGDVLVSPSGTFNGRLQADGNFIVSYGPNPNTSLLWAANYSNPSAGPVRPLLCVRQWGPILFSVERRRAGTVCSAKHIPNIRHKADISATQ